VYVDLGSTNGSRVNGESVSEVVLGVGDQIEIGETTLLLEVAEDAP
jgi:pSer/pThr/pTyr-binding forkhead associated (FHA) protein